MKKEIISLITVFVFFAFTNAQDVVINEKLLAQVTKNQVVRLASNEAFLNSYEKQKKLYDDVNQKMLQVVAIQDFIYSNLVNVNSALKQGKRMIYLTKTFVEIGQNATLVLSLTNKHPEYAILLYRFYEGAVKELYELRRELTNDILREDADFLMDPSDRTQLINNVFMRAQLVNGNLLCIIYRLRDAKKTPYLYQIPGLSNYVNHDRALVNDIINRYKYSF